jgi:8-oxo-dGTP pyrophosphatase MutT (NUDIX family)
MILCRTWDGKMWTLPSGKMNQNEDGPHAAARETYEETGFDINAEYGKTKAIATKFADEGKAVPWNVLDEDDQISFMDCGKRRTVYVCRGVPEDFKFEPVARKEVR